MTRGAPPALPGRSRGAVLIIALIMLLLMSLLALSALRSTIMEERMAASTVDRAFAFQATERALRVAEGAIRLARPAITQRTSDSVGQSCTSGYCNEPNPAKPSIAWKKGEVWAGAKTVTDLEVNDITTQAFYIVELIATGVPAGPCMVEEDPDAVCITAKQDHYRITACSADSAAECATGSAGGRSVVLLQSTFAR